MSLETITLPDGTSAKLVGKQVSQLKRTSVPGWPSASAEACAHALNGKLERLLALDDLLHWIEVGGRVILCANAGILLGAPDFVGVGEPDCLVDIPGAAIGAGETFVGCFASAADGAPCRFATAAALDRGWLALGGWAIVCMPPGVVA